MSLDVVKGLSRDDLETDLTFLSLLLFRNELKPDTRHAIEALREGEVHFALPNLRHFGCVRLCISPSSVYNASFI